MGVVVAPRRLALEVGDLDVELTHTPTSSADHLAESGRVDQAVERLILCAPDLRFLGILEAFRLRDLLVGCRIRVALVSLSVRRVVEVSHELLEDPFLKEVVQHGRAICGLTRSFIDGVVRMVVVVHGAANQLGVLVLPRHDLFESVSRSC
ncbi:MAG: hypothetical protein K0R99_3812 [Microbacterium sp.]|jgi:hypothetical protein|nr:hypothetical protein [Microbacterium sp.]